MRSLGSDINKNQYLGLGFGESMNDAEMVICMRVGKVPVCNEYKSTGKVKPTLVTPGRAVMKEGVVSPEQFAYFEFTFPHAVGDDIKILWSKGVATGIEEFTKHTARGEATINIKDFPTTMPVSD